jgi:hypothetical protein
MRSEDEGLSKMYKYDFLQYFTANALLLKYSSRKELRRLLRMLRHHGASLLLIKSTKATAAAVP